MRVSLCVNLIWCAPLLQLKISLSHISSRTWQLQSNWETMVIRSLERSAIKLFFLLWRVERNRILLRYCLLRVSKCDRNKKGLWLCALLSGFGVLEGFSFSFKFVFCCKKITSFSSSLHLKIHTIHTKALMHRCPKFLSQKRLQFWSMTLVLVSKIVCACSILNPWCDPLKAISWHPSSLCTGEVSPCLSKTNPIDFDPRLWYEAIWHCSWVRSPYRLSDYGSNFICYIDCRS